MAKMIFGIFKQGEEDVRIASRARWDAQLKGLVEVNKRCQNEMQEMKLLSGRQEIIEGYGGRQNHVAEKSNRIIVRTDI